MDTISKDIPGFNGLYRAYSDGKIFSKRRNRFLRGGLDGRGYPTVLLYKKGQKRIHGIVHRIIASIFVENIKNYKFVNHKNNIKTDNRAENLEWCTLEYNNAHAVNYRKIKPQGIKKHHNKWQVSMSIFGKRKYVSFHKNKSDAIAAYQNAAKERLLLYT